MPCYDPQVLSKALQVWGLLVIPLDSPDMRSAAQEPQHEQAFLCNLQVRVGVWMGAGVGASVCGWACGWVRVWGPVCAGRP